MSQSLEIKEALRDLRNATAVRASKETEDRLLQKFRRRRSRSRLVFSGWVAAACLLLSMGWFWSHRPLASNRARLVTGESYRQALAGFVPLPYGQSEVPIEQAVIVRMELAPAQWEALGGRQHSKVNGLLQADLLVGQDGVARAVRLIR